MEDENDKDLGVNNSKLLDLNSENLENKNDKGNKYSNMLDQDEKFKSSKSPKKKDKEKIELKIINLNSTKKDYFDDANQ